jgi:hypothetical protein
VERVIKSGQILHFSSKGERAKSKASERLFQLSQVVQPKATHNNRKEVRRRGKNRLLPARLACSRNLLR